MWCHLFSDNLTELHRFAARLGLKRTWFQQPPQASWCHYDLTASKRLQALKLGAQPADAMLTIAIARGVRYRNGLCRRIRQQRRKQGATND